MKRVVLSGQVRPNTGIGVVQQQIYPFLQQAFEQTRQTRNRDLGQGAWERAVGMIIGLAPVVRSDAYLAMVPPLPAAIRGRVVAVVHDLRWKDTRRGLGRLYRAVDLRRTIRRADALICISERTYEDLINFSPRAVEKAVVQRLGPGQTPSGNFVDGQFGKLILLGGARHKRNEEAAQMLARVRPTWLTGVTGVGVSSAVRSTIDEAFGLGFGRWLQNLSVEDLAHEYRQADVMMLLSRDEGFGLPYIEALASGCQVIVQDQPLTRELLGTSAIYIDADDDKCLAVLSDLKRVEEEVRRRKAEEYDWADFAACVVSKLR